MQSWIYFALFAQLIWAFCSLIDKFVISKGYIKSPFVYIVLNGAMNVFLIFLLPFFNFEPLKFADFLVALLGGVSLSIAVAVYYKAVQFDEISRIKIIFQMEPILILLLAFLFLGEILTKSHMIGFLFLLAAGMIVAYKRGRKSFHIGGAFYYILVSMAFGAVGYVSAKHIFNVTGFWSGFLWLRLTSSTALAVLLAPSVRKQFAETFRNMKTGIKKLLGFKMAVDFSAFVFASYALSKGQASLVGVLETAAAPLFVFILTLFTSFYFPGIIREKIDKKTIITKISAILLAIIGILFVN